MKPTKKEKRVIARRARLLPEMEFSNKFDRVRTSGAKILASNPDAKDGNGKPISASQVYLVPVRRRVNHFKEMKRAFEQGGMDAVDRYEAYMKETAAKDVEDIKAEAQRIANERLEAAQEHATPKVEQEGAES